MAALKTDNLGFEYEERRALRPFAFVYDVAKGEFAKRLTPTSSVEKTLARSLEAARREASQARRKGFIAAVGGFDEADTGLPRRLSEMERELTAIAALAIETGKSQPAIGAQSSPGQKGDGDYFLPFFGDAYSAIRVRIYVEETLANIKEEVNNHQRIYGIIYRYTRPVTLPPIPKQEEMIRQTFADLPEGVDQRAAVLEAIHLAYRQAYAEQLEPIVTARIKQSVDSGTSQEAKRNLVKELNEELRHGGLAIRCEVQDDSGQTTNKPGIFMAGTARHEGGRFLVQFSDDRGHIKRFGVTGDTHIHLMPAPAEHSQQLTDPSAASFASKFGKQRPKDSGHQPGS